MYVIRLYQIVAYKVESLGLVRYSAIHSAFSCFVFCYFIYKNTGTNGLFYIRYRFFMFAIQKTDL